MDDHTKVDYEGHLVPLSEVDRLLESREKTLLTVEVLYKDEWLFDNDGLCMNAGACERLTWRQVALAQAIGDSSFPDEMIDNDDTTYHFFFFEDGSVFAEESKIVAVWQGDSGFYWCESFSSSEEYEDFITNQLAEEEEVQ